MKSGLPKVFVYGSCVARDALATVPKRYQVSRYIARQSLLSVGHDASANLPALDEFAHGFQRRIVASDWSGNLLHEVDVALGDGSVDALLWDLTDERYGVHWFPDGGVATRTVDVQGTSLMKLLPPETHVPFGSPEHLEGWDMAADEFATFLRARGLLEKTMVLRIPWAARSVDGSPVPASAGMDAKAAEEAFEPYFSRLKALGFAVADLRQGPEALADPGHRWGLAPFHYAPEVYERIVAALDAWADAHLGAPVQS